MKVLFTHPESENQGLHPDFARLTDKVSAEGLARRLRITPRQAQRFLDGSGLSHASWGDVSQRLGFERGHPVCYSVAEVAAMLGVSANAVRAWIKAGKLVALPGVRPIRLPANRINRAMVGWFTAGGSYPTEGKTR